MFYKKIRCYLDPNAGQGGAAGAGTQGNGAGSQTSGQAGQNNSSGQGNASQPPQIDYSKIQQMLEGTLKAKEETALKAYFKQQNMTEEQMNQAIAAFKQQQAANTPDMAAIQTNLENAQKAALQANIEKEAMFLAGELGVDLKTMPYILKLADLASVADDKGNINKETLKNSLNKVLEELPQLKPASAGGANGFRQIGAGSAGANNAAGQEDLIAAAFGNKK